MRALLVLTVAVALAACTTFDLEMGWTKPDASVAQTSRDEWACHRRVSDAPRTTDAVVGGAVDAVRLFEEASDRERRLIECMRGRGYTPTAPPGLGKALRLPAFLTQPW